MTISNWGREGLVNTTTSGGQYFASSARLKNGNYVTVWEDNSTSFGEIRAQIFDTTGKRLEVS